VGHGRFGSIGDHFDGVDKMLALCAQAIEARVLREIFIRNVSLRGLARCGADEDQKPDCYAAVPGTSVQSTSARPTAAGTTPTPGIAASASVSRGCLDPESLPLYIRITAHDHSGLRQEIHLVPCRAKAARCGCWSWLQVDPATTSTMMGTANSTLGTPAVSDTHYTKGCACRPPLGRGRPFPHRSTAGSRLLCRHCCQHLTARYCKGVHHLHYESGRRHGAQGQRYEPAVKAKA
jgi:hypothetical protein